MNGTEFYKQVDAGDPQPAEPYAHLQWKGTDACVTIHCVCGHDGHLDEEFLYHYRCPKCRAAYALSPYIRLVRLTPEAEAFVDAGGACAFRSDVIYDDDAALADTEKA